MQDLNRAIIIGRLTKDAESRQAGQSTLTAISLAVNGYKDTVSYIDVEVWGKLGEVIQQYCHKGSRIAVEGKINQQRWEKDGQKKNKIVIVADNVQFLDSKKTVPEGDILSSGTDVTENPFKDDNIPF